MHHRKWVVFLKLAPNRITILLAVLIPACTLSCVKKQALEDDFIEAISPEKRANVWVEIATLRDSIESDFTNPTLHRELAVMYRLAGTPESRLHSLAAIEKAISLDPNNPRNHIEKGLTMRARQYLGEAKNCFEFATILDPKCFEAWYQLGRMEEEEYFKMMCYADHLRKSIRHYQKAYRLDRKNEELLQRLGLLHILRQMYKTGRKYVRKAIVYYPENPRSHLLLGTIHTYLKEFDKAEDAFETAFGLMADEELRPFKNISHLLGPEDRELYRSSTDERKLKWNKRFWAENDPTPATEINERRLEHYKRIYLAQEFLTNKRLGLNGDETDRGRALISYGLPDKKYYDLGGGLVGPWIIWQYDLPNLSFNLYFQDEFLNGNFHIPISDRAYGEGTVRLMDNIPQGYEYPIKYTTSPILVETAQSRGSEERTRIEFSVAVPDTILSRANGGWRLDLTFFDNDWNRISHDHFSVDTGSLVPVSKIGERFLVNNFWFEILPRPMGCICVIEIVNETEKRKGSWKHPLPVDDLFGRSLKLSSIKLTVPDDVRECTEILDPLPVYEQGGFLCLSYQIYNLKRNENNQARYRLTYTIRNPEEGPEDKKGIQRTLSYMWKSIRGGRPEASPYITSTIEQSINESLVDDRLQIDVSTLEYGRYRLVLLVEDLISGQAVIGERDFSIMGSAEM